MIGGEFAQIRMAEPDDASALLRLYRDPAPRAGLLDPKREPLMPALDELRELLGHKEMQQGAFYAVEDPGGIIRGFCGLRGAGFEAAYGEIRLLFLDDSDFGSPIATETLAFLCKRAFGQMNLREILAVTLDSEQGYRALLLSQGFVSDGIQRQVFFGRGRWHDLETFSRFAPALTSA